VTTPVGWLTELGAGLRGLAVDAGVLGYRPVARQGPGGWDAGYAAGEWDRMATVEESARYAVLGEYLHRACPSPSILDVGCGPGLLRERIQGAPFDRYVGVDVSAEAIRRAQHLADERTAFLVGNPAAAPGGPFDVVVCNEVLYYLDDIAAFLAALGPVMAPGGHLLTSNWRHPGDRRLHTMLDARFALVDRVEVANTTSRRLRWRVAWHRERPRPRGA